ncbi:phosphotransferase family enzyme [Nitrospirillum viridazoti]|nr:phosphotransferase family enzyme [Nitrospirillum amazonense]
MVRGAKNINPVFQELKQLLAAQEDRDGECLIGICHGDAWLGNAKWSDGRAVLFDFEYARVGPVVYDIASFIWSLQEVRDNDLQLALFKNFVQGYRSVYDVSFDEGALKANVLRREIHNIEFLSTHIAMSSEVQVAATELAKATCALVQSDRFLEFSWH